MIIGIIIGVLIWIVVSVGYTFIAMGEGMCNTHWYDGILIAPVFVIIELSNWLRGG